MHTHPYNKCILWLVSWLWYTATFRSLRSIDYILFVRALGVSMWKQSWLKCFNLNIPLFLIRANFMKKIKKHCQLKLYITKHLNCFTKSKKIFCMWQATNLTSLRKLLWSYFVTIIQMLLSIFLLNPKYYQNEIWLNTSILYNMYY